MSLCVECIYRSHDIIMYSLLGCGIAVKRELYIRLRDGIACVIVKLFIYVRNSRCVGCVGSQ